MLDALLPTTLAASVELATGGRSLSASVRVAMPAAGTLDVVGAAGIEAPAPLDARWSWSGGDLGNLVNRLAPDAAAGIAGGLVVAGGVTAHGRLVGDLGSPTVDGELEVRDLSSFLPAVRPCGGSAANTRSPVSRGRVQPRRSRSTCPRLG